jgi:hypothetical protein
MMLHPDQVSAIIRERQEMLRASNRPFRGLPGGGPAWRFIRRQVGLALIGLGMLLGGHPRRSSPSGRVSTSRT